MVEMRRKRVEYKEEIGSKSGGDEQDMNRRLTEYDKDIKRI